jgi:hypothetical protein
MIGLLTCLDIRERRVWNQTWNLPANKESRKITIFIMICVFLQGKDLITCKILILQGFLTFQEDQLGNNPCFRKILYTTTILIIQGH